MLKKNGKVLITGLKNSEIGFKKLYPSEMKEYVGTVATVINRYTSHGNVMVLTEEDHQRRIFLRSDLVSLDLTPKQKREWSDYLVTRDKEQGEPYSWHSILTDEDGHKLGLERILGIESFTLDECIYQDILSIIA